MTDQERLVALRDRLGWSREQLGRFLDVSSRTVQRWELGETTTPNSTAVRVVEALWNYTDSDARIAHVQDVARSGNVRNLVQEALGLLKE